MTENVEDISKMSFGQKMSALRKAIIEQDWTDDGTFDIGGRDGKSNRSYGYVSADKIKRNINSLFHRYGLEVRMAFSELEARGAVGLMSQHWTLRLDATIFDPDSGKEFTSTVYGEAADSGDKGVSKAHTYAFKNWVCTTFMIADGTDPDSTFSGTTSFHTRTDAESEAVMSRILENTVHVPPMPEKAPAAPKEEPKKPAAPAPRAPPKAPVKAAPKAPADAANEAADMDMRTAEMFPEVSPPKRNAIVKIADDWRAKKSTGEVPLDAFMSMSAAMSNIKTDQDAVDFIKTFNRQ